MKTEHGWKCNRCGTEREVGRLPRAWKFRNSDHICPKCWGNEPEERQLVYKYHVSRAGLELPDAFWWQQKAARLLWDKLVEIDEEALKRTAQKRALYAPKETAAAEKARDEARASWEAVQIAHKAWKVATSTPQSAELRAAYLDAQKEARLAGKRSSEAFAEAKKAAKAAGCDESPIWGWRDKQVSQAAMWNYTTREVDGRMVVEQSQSDEQDGSIPHHWRLQRSLADQIIDEYRTAWSAWVTHRSSGRGMPRKHGMAIGDQVRTSLRYTNGQTLSHFISGTPSFTLNEVGLSKSGKVAMSFKMAIGCGEFVSGIAVIDRPIPDGTDAIRKIELVGRRWADQWDWTLNVTCRTRLELLPHGPRCDAVAVDLRWRKDSDEPSHLMVAEWLSTNGDWGHIWIDRSKTCRERAQSDPPTSWDGYQQKQSEMDKRLEELKALIWNCYGEGKPYTEAFRLMRSKGIMRNREQWPFCKTEIDAWLEWNSTMLRRMAHLRDKLIARRDQLYYEQSHRICQTADTIILEADTAQGRKMSIKALAEAEVAPAGGQRHTLAPGRFRLILLEVAKRYGCEIALVDKIGTSMVCPNCGKLVQTGPTDVHCSCGTHWTRPEGATHEMIRRWKLEHGGSNGSGTRGNTPRGTTSPPFTSLGDDLHAPI